MLKPGDKIRLKNIKTDIEGTVVFHNGKEAYIRWNDSSKYNSCMVKFENLQKV